VCVCLLSGRWLSEAKQHVNHSTDFTLQMPLNKEFAHLLLRHVLHVGGVRVVTVIRAAHTRAQPRGAKSLFAPVHTAHQY
jgi:hypothetical protein